MSHWVVKVGLETGAATGADEIIARIRARSDVRSVVTVVPQVLVVEPQPATDVESLAIQLAEWIGVSYARAVLRDDVDARTA